MENCPRTVPTVPLSVGKSTLTKVRTSEVPGGSQDVRGEEGQGRLDIVPRKPLVITLLLVTLTKGRLVWLHKKRSVGEEVTAEDEVTITRISVPGEGQTFFLSEKTSNTTGQ